MSINASLKSLRPLAEHILQERRIGLEREALRVDANACLSLQPHPQALGASLTHPQITTDYSESMLELVTEAHASPEAAHAQLTTLSAFVQQQLPEEWLWASSMPCTVGDSATIPIAEFGHSAVGQAKHRYRVGLAHRYGRLMQIIAGVHFNYSLPPALFQALRPELPEREAINQGYFAMTRNLQRCGWLVPWLFGASPAACRSLARGRATPLLSNECLSLIGIEATSLRLGDVGYSNANKRGYAFHADYTALPEYIRSLLWAVTTERADYAAIGTRGPEGPRQLSCHHLQIENEYYSSVRPKQSPRSGESPLSALASRGVGYLELRSLDLDPFEPTGVSLQTMRVLECLMLYCALLPSPPLGEGERSRIEHNWSQVAHFGRQPTLMLQCQEGECSVQEWAGRMIADLEQIAHWLDQAQGQGHYTEAMETRAVAVLRDMTRSPSARILSELSGCKHSFIQWTQQQSRAHADTLRNMTLPADVAAALQASVPASHQARQALEASGQTFEQWWDDYRSGWQRLQRSEL